MGGHALGHHTLSPAVRRSLKACAGGGLALVILAMAGASWAATYRWLDEQGRVHYGDSIPPQYAGQGHSELNRQGRVIRQVERAPGSAEARARREREAAQKLAQEKADLERQRRDSALLATFASTHEIDLARQRALDQEQAQIDSLVMMRKHQEPGAEANYLDGQIRVHRNNLDAIRARYEADKARFIELTGGR
jgi:hypothetical protein